MLPAANFYEALVASHTCTTPVISTGIVYIPATVYLCILYKYTRMKYLFSIISVISFCVFTSPSFAQPPAFSGIWEGDLDAGIQKLRLIFTIAQDEAGKTTLTMQSPQQSAAHIPADTVFTEGSGTIGMEMKKFKISFKGTLVNDSTISGNFVQGVAMPLQLKKVKKATVVEKAKRPQTPKPPFPYKSLDVSFHNNDNSLTFGGTLTVPDTSAGSKYPAVILISGSGPQDRNETIFGHKPFAVIADHLTKKGFAVLRVDDRGVGKSTGNHALATSADFANDTEAAVDYLKTRQFIHKGKIGLIGHSEGAMIAPLVASGRKDISYIVLLAGPGIPCIDLLAEQNVAIFKSSGMDTAKAEAYGPLFKALVKNIINAADSAAAVAGGTKLLEKWDMPDSLKTVFKISTKEEAAVFAKGIADAIYNPWFRYFLRYDPVPVIKKLSCAVLALNGSKDLQVLPRSNLAGIENALKKSKTKNYEVKEIPQVNHLFQTCNKCTLDEYATLEESFSPAVLDMITAWLLKQVK